MFERKYADIGEPRTPARELPKSPEEKIKYFRDLAIQLSQKIKAALIEDKKLSGTGISTQEDAEDMKSKHKSDQVAIDVIKDFLKNERCNIFLESAESINRDDAEFSILIDPIDGSLNWDRETGDPCIAIAMSEKTKDICFDDLSFAYVEGLRSRDVYTAENGKSFYISGVTGNKEEIKCSSKANTMPDAIAILRPGYSLAAEQFKSTFPFFAVAKDIRAEENSAIELAYVARGAADVMIEARKGSDHFNLLAYPILKNAGGFVVDLKGKKIGRKIIDPKGKLDFIASGNKALLKEVVEKMNIFRLLGGFNGKGIEFKDRDNDMVKYVR